MNENAKITINEKRKKTTKENAKTMKENTTNTREHKSPMSGWHSMGNWAQVPWPRTQRKRQRTMNENATRTLNENAKITMNEDAKKTMNGNAKTNE